MRVAAISDPVHSWKAGGRTGRRAGFEDGPRDRDGLGLFDSADYLDAFDVDRVVRVQPPEATGTPLAFEHRGDHMVFLARSARIDRRTLETAVAGAFADGAARYLVLRDLVAPEAPRGHAGTLAFRCRNDWIVPLPGDEGGVPHSVRRKTDRSLRLMRRDHGPVELDIVERPDRATVAAILALARDRIEGSGRAFQIDGSEQQRLVRLAARRGVAVLLRSGGRIVSGEIFAAHRDAAYLIVGGYDEAFARHSPGMVTMRFGIEHFRKAGLERVHLLWGDYPYKGRLGGRPLALTTLVVARDRWVWLSPRFLAEVWSHLRPDLMRRLQRRAWLYEPLKRAWRWSNRTLLRRPG